LTTCFLAIVPLVFASAAKTGTTTAKGSQPTRNASAGKAAKSSQPKLSSQATSYQQDARLQRRVTLDDQTWLSVATVLQLLSKAANVALEADGMFSERMLRCHVKDVRVCALMTAVQHSLMLYGRGARWTRTSKGYRLDVDPDGVSTYQDEAERELAEFLEQLECAIDFGGASEAERKNILAKHPEVATLYERWREDPTLYRNSEPYFFKILRDNFTSDDVSAVLNGEARKVTFAELDRSTQRFLESGRSRIPLSFAITPAGRVATQLEACQFTFKLEGSGLERKLRLTIEDLSTPSSDPLTTNLLLCYAIRMEYPKRLASQTANRNRQRGRASNTIGDSLKSVQNVVVPQEGLTGTSHSQVFLVELMKVHGILPKRPNLVIERATASSRMLGNGDAILRSLRNEHPKGPPLDAALNSVTAAYGCTWEPLADGIIVFGSVRDKADYVNLIPSTN